MIKDIRALELLSPARDLSTGIAAIDCGADAVYIGAEHHGARAAAANSIDDIRLLCDYAHKFRAKIYVTLNTLIFDNELESVRELICRLYEVGVDALIIQDFSILEMNIPPIELHASTQCDIRTVEKAVLMERLGFSQIVLPREMTAEEILKVHQNTNVTLEAFVHGALCVSYSGDCRASFVNGGRSANRGECAQICRLPYNLTDGDGNVIKTAQHLLSLKDLNRLNNLAELIDAGISSFKIEGRLKSVDYVRNVTAAYSEALNRYIDLHKNRFVRSSCGISHAGFRPDVSKSFNRGFTTYFLNNPNPGKSALGSHATAKFVGETLGTVSIEKNAIKIKGSDSISLNNGDGLTFFDMKGMFRGFRVNKVENRLIYPNLSRNEYPDHGTLIYRNYDKRFADIINKAKSLRKIRTSIRLEYNEGILRLEAIDERGCHAIITHCYKYNPANTNQKDFRYKNLTKTGDTIYHIERVEDLVEEKMFIQASILSELRRRLIEALDNAAASTYPLPNSKWPKRKPLCQLSNEPQPQEKSLSSPSGVFTPISNRLSKKLCDRLKVANVEDAIEVLPTTVTEKEIRVMTSRYCLRRELGYCMKTPEGRLLKEPLTLAPVNSSVRTMRLEFDCRNCRMHVYALPSRR